MSRERCCSCCNERPYYRENQNNLESNAQNLNESNSWCWGRPCSPNSRTKYNGNNEEAEIKVITNIKICQNAEANGGDGEGGDGGDGGDATGGNAIAATAESEGDGDATVVIVTSTDEENENNHGAGRSSTKNATAENLKDLLPEQLRSLSPEQIEALQSLLDGVLGIAIGDAAAVGGSATGGDGGNGGDGTGGDGGTAENTATVNVEQVLVIVPDNNGLMPAVTLGTNSNNVKKNVDITMDENGNTFVNGQKMDEQELANGTKVFIFRNSETKETKKKGK